MQFGNDSFLGLVLTKGRPNVLGPWSFGLFCLIVQIIKMWYICIMPLLVALWHKVFYPKDSKSKGIAVVCFSCRQIVRTLITICLNSLPVLNLRKRVGTQSEIQSWFMDCIMPAVRAWPQKITVWLMFDAVCLLLSNKPSVFSLSPLWSHWAADGAVQGAELPANSRLLSASKGFCNLHGCDTKQTSGDNKAQQDAGFRLGAHTCWILFALLDHVAVESHVITCWVLCIDSLTKYLCLFSNGQKSMVKHFSVIGVAIDLH